MLMLRTTLRQPVTAGTGQQGCGPMFLAAPYHSIGVLTRPAD
jgi:hypothetical protein